MLKNPNAVPETVLKSDKMVLKIRVYKPKNYYFNLSKLFILLGGVTVRK